MCTYLDMYDLMLSSAAYIVEGVDRYSDSKPPSHGALASRTNRLSQKSNKYGMLQCIYCIIFGGL